MMMEIWALERAMQLGNRDLASDILKAEVVSIRLMDIQGGRKFLIQRQVFNLGVVCWLDEEISGFAERFSGYSWGRREIKSINWRCRQLLFSISSESFYSLFKKLSLLLPMASHKGKAIVFEEDSDDNNSLDVIKAIPLAEIDSLASSFTTQISFPIRVAPLVVNTPSMNRVLEESFKFSVVLKCLDVNLAFNTIKNNIRKTWPDMELALADPLEMDVFQVDFKKEDDFWKVVNEQPWILANHVMQVVPWINYHQIGRACFRNFSVWCQLPQFLALFVNGKILDEVLAKTTFFPNDEIKVYEFFSGATSDEKFVRIKMVLDIEKSLPPCFNLEYRGKEVWIPFAFEFIHMFCYRCGQVGHHQQKCQVPDHLASDLYNQRNRTFMAFPNSKMVQRICKNMEPKIQGEMDVSNEDMKMAMEFGKEVKQEAALELGVGANARNWDSLLVGMQKEGKEKKPTGAASQIQNVYSFSGQDNYMQQVKNAHQHQGSSLTVTKVRQEGSAAGGRGSMVRNTSYGGFRKGSSMKRQSTWVRQVKYNYEQGTSSASIQTIHAGLRSGKEQQGVGLKASIRAWCGRQGTPVRKRGAEQLASVVIIPPKEAEELSKDLSTKEETKSNKVNLEALVWKKSKINGDPNTNSDLSALQFLQDCYNDPVIHEAVTAEAKRTGQRQSSKEP